MNKMIVTAMGLGALVLLLCVFMLNRGHRQLTDARRDAEAARLALAHQTVEAAETRRQLQTSVEDLLAKNSELAAAVVEAKAAAPSAQPVSASELQTAPEKVIYKPGPAHAETLAVLSGAPSGNRSASSATGAVPDTCALSTQDSAWFKVDLVELSTKEQNTLVVGTSELWAQGSDMTDRRVLGPSRFQSQVSNSASLAPAAQPRWGLELGGLCQRDGCGPGGGVLFPPWAVLGVRLEPRADAYAGPSPGVAGWVGARW